ncbi:hypothetical protein EIP86_009752 [Pleurotus ostreatoroseus]|nr:hypothetical protein EIP86_009752 [Pleurotus ostreatoroseus]
MYEAHGMMMLCAVRGILERGAQSRTSGRTVAEPSDIEKALLGEGHADRAVGPSACVSPFLEGQPPVAVEKAPYLGRHLHGIRGRAERIWAAAGGAPSAVILSLPQLYFASVHVAFLLLPLSPFIIMIVHSPSSLPVTLLSLVVSLASCPLIDARAAPSPAALGQSVPMLRRSTQRFSSLEELGSWAENNKLRTEAKYGMNSPICGWPQETERRLQERPEASLSTSRHEFKIVYGSGSAEGVLGSDKVQFAGFEVNQTFGLVNSTTSQLLTSPLSGLMGLAFQSIAASGATPFWQSLAETSGTLDSSLFAFQLTRFTNASNVNNLEPGGTFTLGAVNNTLFTGSIDYQDIPDGAPGYWIQELSSMTVNGQSISLPSGSDAWAAIDTGTTGVGCPSDVLASIFSAIPGSAKGTGQLNGYYTFPCSTAVTVEVKWGSSSNSWAISPADFILQQTDQDTCVGTFFEVDSSGTTAPAFIFGDTFLKNVYSVYRSSPGPSVGFAALSSTSTDMNGVNGPVPSASVGSAVVVSPTSTSSTNSGSSPSSSGAGRSTALAPTAVLLSVLMGVVTVWA